MLSHLCLGSYLPLIFVCQETSQAHNTRRAPPLMTSHSSATNSLQLIKEACMKACSAWMFRMSRCYILSQKHRHQCLPPLMTDHSSAANTPIATAQGGVHESAPTMDVPISHVARHTALSAQIALMTNPASAFNSLKSGSVAGLHCQVCMTWCPCYKHTDCKQTLPELWQHMVADKTAPMMMSALGLSVHPQ